MDSVQAANERVATYVHQLVHGHDRAIRFMVAALGIGGHVLLEGPPGIAKTLLARTFADALGLGFKRIQFTPDLMPSDITGVTVFQRENGSFRFIPGPIFSQVILADEINRAPPKTQSALLEAMQERAVTVDGERRSLGSIFLVLATQNPLEHEGTFPLPEAQLDRFLFRVVMGYPSALEERRMIERFSSHTVIEGHAPEIAALSIADIEDLRARIVQVRLAPAMTDYIMRIIFETRQHASLMLGASPRAALNVALACKAEAALSGRDYAIPDDVKSVIHAVLAHRLFLKSDFYESSGGTGEVIDEIVARTPVPDGVV